MSKLLNNMGKLLNKLLNNNFWLYFKNEVIVKPNSQSHSNN